MFNFLVSYSPDSWDLTPFDMEIKRFGEYTRDDIKNRLKSFDRNAIEELKSYICLLMTEGESAPSRIGYITEIKIRQMTGRIGIKYHFDPILPEIPKGEIAKLKSQFDIPDYEMNRSHWAVKDEDLLETFLSVGLLTPEQVASSKSIREGRGNLHVPSQDQQDKKKIFIVHGRDNETKQEMARLIEKLGLKAIILHEQANQGMTIIEKIESNTDVGFSVVLYTPCDVGALSGRPNLLPRARQNVVFEHGFLIGKLGRDKVSAFVKGEVETPNDISGIVYTSLDERGAWKAELVRELRAAGYDVSMNTAL